MNVQPGATYEAVIETGTTGLAGTIRLRVIDNAGGVTEAASAVGIAERAYGVYAATGQVASDDSGQYSLVWDDGTDDGVLGIEDLFVTFGFTAPVGDPGFDAYTTLAELQRILKIRQPDDAQTAAMQRVLTAAYVEINSEIDLASGVELTEDQLAIAAEVNLERAVEHWQQSGTAFGILGIDDRGGATYIAKDSWERHAMKLAPLKNQWGFA